MLEPGRALGPVSRRRSRCSRFVNARARTHPRPSYPRTLAIAIALYSYWALAGMAVFGRDAWTRSRARASRSPFGLPLPDRAVRRTRRRGSSSAGRSRASPASDRTSAGTLRLRRGDARLDELRRLQPDRRRGRTCLGGRAREARRRLGSGLARARRDHIVNIAGLPRVRGGRRPHVPLRRPPPRLERSRTLAAPLAADFVLPRSSPSPSPISLPTTFRWFVSYGQFVIPNLLSDPFGRGWDLFGTVDFVPNVASVLAGDDLVRRRSSRSPWGHVAGLAVAHDRAVDSVRGPAPWHSAPSTRCSR